MFVVLFYFNKVIESIIRVFDSESETNIRVLSILIVRKIFELVVSILIVGKV